MCLKWAKGTESTPNRRRCPENQETALLLAGRSVIFAAGSLRGFRCSNPLLPRPSCYASWPWQGRLGSGVMVDPSGLVVTNVHVIEGADEVKVSLSDKREFEAEIILKDPRSDLAVLRLKGAHEQFPTLDFANSDELMVGDVVLAIGNPFGVGQTVTHGIISALARTQVGITDYQFFIQPDPPITPAISAAP